MSVQVTIVGLGQVGASVGMALGKHRAMLHRVGHDKEPQTAKAAEKKGAVDEVKFNLPASVRGAKVVLLGLPVGEIRSVLEVIAPDLPEGAVVMDTSPVKKPLAGWARELLPSGRYYVGLVPAINPQYLHRIETGVNAAQADLFQKGVVMLDVPPNTPEEAVRLAADFVRLLGATPVYADLDETDGFMAKMHLLPQLAAAALLNAVVDQPGWSDARKLAGRPFSALTSALAYQDDARSLAEAAVLNRENTARALDLVIGSLQGLRDDVMEGNRESISERLELALEGRARWLAERTRADWLEVEKSDLSTIPGFWERLLGSRENLKKRG
ncbi:MAG: prephenate dehydrogenase [Chloroflexota bacterium]